MATRSNSPATEYTSDTPSTSAIACAASPISSTSHWIRTTACTLTGRPSSCPLEDDGESLPAADAQRREPQGGSGCPQLVRQRQDDPGAAHTDRVPQADAPTVHVEPVTVELQLAFARDDLRGEGLVDLDPLEVVDRQPGRVQDLLRGGHRPE